MKPRQSLASIAVAVAATAMLLAGCGNSTGNATSPPKSTSTPATPASGGSGAVSISNFKFAPASLTVKSGAKITVTNEDSTAHTATADDGNSFDTGPLNQGSSKTISVSKPGSYAYHCSIHPFMKGTIVVQ